MESEDSLPHLQESTTGLFLEPDEFSPHHQTFNKTVSISTVMIMVCKIGTIQVQVALICHEIF